MDKHVGGVLHRHAIVSLTEGKSRLALLRKVECKTAQAVEDAVIEPATSLPVRIHTITADKGPEVETQERIAKELNTVVYFAHPFSIWEGATNENMNGLIHQCFPKKCCIAPIAENNPNSSWRNSITDQDNVLDSNHQIKYSLFLRPLLHLVVESKVNEFRSSCSRIF